MNERNKRNHVVSAVCLMLLLPAVALALPAWEYQWDAAELPEDFMEGDVFSASVYNPEGSTVTRSVSDGIYTVQTSVDPVNANASYKTLPNVWDAANPSTFEFRFKNEDVEDRQYYATALLLRADAGQVGFKFAWDHGSNPWEENSYKALYRDEDGFSTVRVLTATDAQDKLASASLYFLDADDNWVFASTSNLSGSSYNDEFLFGDIGGNWGGKWNEDYFYWTSEAATLGTIVPEPTTIALLLTGAAGMLTRRKKK